MKIEKNLAAILLILLFSSCLSEKTIELDLNEKTGYGALPSLLSVLATYGVNQNNSVENVKSKIVGIPKYWSNINCGLIETNYYQSTYQSYLSGTMTKKDYLSLSSSQRWPSDTSYFSKIPINCKIAVAYGKDSVGKYKMIVDANNNFNLADDIEFSPIEYDPSHKNIDKDSLAFKNTINVTFERYLNDKIEKVSAPLFISYMRKIDKFLFNFAIYSVAELEGEKIEICSNGFTDFTYSNPRFVLPLKGMHEFEKVSTEKVIYLNEYIEINTKLYKPIVVNPNKQTLIVEKIRLPKNEISSSQVGFKSIVFDGKDFLSKSDFSLNDLKGKYVVLDFWATWCKPCIKDFPELKLLHQELDSEKIEFVGVVDESRLKQLKNIIETNSISWPQILSNESNLIFEKYNIKSYPTTFLLDPEGTIIAKNLRGEKLKEKIITILNNKNASR